MKLEFSQALECNKISSRLELIDTTVHLNNKVYWAEARIRDKITVEIFNRGKTTFSIFG